MEETTVTGVKAGELEMDRVADRITLLAVTRGQMLTLRSREEGDVRGLVERVDALSDGKIRVRFWRAMRVVRITGMKLEWVRASTTLWSRGKGCEKGFRHKDDGKRRNVDVFVSPPILPSDFTTLRWARDDELSDEITQPVFGFDEWSGPTTARWIEPHLLASLASQRGYFLTYT